MRPAGAQDLRDRMQARDGQGLGALLADDQVVEWPVGGERIVGGANFVGGGDRGAPLTRGAGAAGCQGRAAEGWRRSQPDQAEVIMASMSWRAFQFSSTAARSAEAMTRAGSPGRRGETVGRRS
ncbi:hypothetical protein FBY37_4217 [Streptomyces sp. SLBN-134]|nr:hypothetical protein FBY37_4217 [Streptomyces sp. SLBN-134]